MQNSADLCVKNGIHSVGRAGHKANVDYCGSFQFLNSCFFLEELNKDLDIEAESISVWCVNAVVSFIDGF